MGVFGEFLINEASKPDLDAIIKEIDAATDNNRHTESWMILADKLLHNNNLVKAFKAIMDIHLYHGHMPSGLNAARQELEDKATEYAKKILTPEEWKRVHAAF